MNNKRVRSAGAASFIVKLKILEMIQVAQLMISHDLHVVMGASDRVICLNGHICCQGTPDNVASSPEYQTLFGSNFDGALALYKHKRSLTPQGKLGNITNAR